jgi:hypothetical protein
MAAAGGLAPRIADLWRVMTINVVVGLVYGWAYWRRGLETAVLAEVSVTAGLYLLIPAVRWSAEAKGASTYSRTPLSDVRQTTEILVLPILRPVTFALAVLNAQQTRTNIVLTDSQGTDVVVTGVAIDYGGLLSVGRETQGIRVRQGDGSVLLKWSDLDTLRVTKRDDTVKPPRVELEIVLRSHKRVLATLLRAGKMQMVGRTDLGEYRIDLDKVMRLVPFDDVRRRLGR